MELEHHYLPNVFISKDKRKLFTKNYIPDVQVYNEELLSYQGIELRAWNPYRSKLAALLLKGSGEVKIKSDDNLLYLGAASGTTASHLSDIVVDGRIYCVEFGERPFRNLVNLCEIRRNMIPILSNARKPNEYKAIVDPVDWIYQDISQRDQVEIFIKNLKMYLKHGVKALIMVKSRSIDVNIQPHKIYDRIQKKLQSENLVIIDRQDLSPYQKDHACFIIDYR